MICRRVWQSRCPYLREREKIILAREYEREKASEKEKRMDKEGERQSQRKRDSERERQRQVFGP